MPVTSKKEIYPVGMPNPLFHMYKYYGDPASAEIYKPIKNRVKDYLKNGIIPTVHDKINSMKP